MKKSLVFILSVSMFLCAMISVSAEDHKHELHKIGERIKEAVKTGKITEKEGWGKWHAGLREHGHHEGDEDHEEYQVATDSKYRHHVLPGAHILHVPSPLLVNLHYGCAGCANFCW